MPSAEPFSVWAAARAIAGVAWRHAVQQHDRLPLEQRQHLALKAVLAERHARQVLDVDQLGDRRERRSSDLLQAFQHAHGILPRGLRPSSGGL